MKTNLQLTIEMVLTIIAILLIGGFIFFTTSIFNAAFAQSAAPVTTTYEVEEQGYDELKLEGYVLGPVQKEDTVLEEQPLSATVYLYDENYNVVAKTETAEDGSYTLFLAPGKKYHIMVEKSGYVSRKFNITTQSAFVAPEEEMDVYMAAASQFNIYRNDFNNKVVAHRGEDNYLDRDEYIEWVEFRIQLGRYNKPISSDYYQKVDGKVETISDGESIVYTTGRFENMNQAKEYLKKIKEQGYDDAFLTAYDLKQNRIPTEVAAKAAAGK